MVNFQQKDFYSIDDLQEIVKLLRSENGCPWDKEQTHKSIKSDFIEEVCEAIEAIDLEDSGLLREELGQDRAEGQCAHRRCDDRGHGAHRAQRPLAAHARVPAHPRGHPGRDRQGHQDERPHQKHPQQNAR